MAHQPIHGQTPITPWQRNLLLSAAVFTVLLIAMGGVLCVTQSIRNCPDWPGCFGSFLPPSETGSILEYTHRFLAAVSGLLILISAVVGVVRPPRLRWTTIPPLVAVVLLVEVSYFGAVVVLRGLSPGWAAVDVGSALLVVALMVAAAMTASTRIHHPGMDDRLSFKTPFARLVLATTAVTYVVMVSGILVAGKDSVSSCLGWPIYSLRLLQLDGHVLASALRWIVSLAGIGLVVSLLVLARRNRRDHLNTYRLTLWLGVAALVEALVQVLLLFFGLPVYLLIIYTVTAAVFWALLVALLVKVGLGEILS